MKRVLFRLSMPGCASWNGEWSGKGKNYTIIKKITDKKAAELDGKSWYHHWNDGWTACIDARVLSAGERVKKSDGFCGYEWMVTNILLYGNTKARIS